MSELLERSGPNSIRDIVRTGRLTALQKPSGGVRGIVAGDVIRRVVAGEAVEAATAPFHCALTTKAGCECVAHAVQALTEQHSDATILSIDGVGAFDFISRESMLGGDAPAGVRLCLSCRCSMASLVRTCGRMILERHTPCTKGRGENKETPLCLSCFPWANIQHSKR